MNCKTFLRGFIVSILGFTLVACNSGTSSSSSNQPPSLVTVNTYNYNPGDKTAVNITIGG